MSGPRLRIVCAWCGKPQGSKPCEPALDGEETHSICPDCYAGVVGELDQLAARQVERDFSFFRLNDETEVTPAGAG